VRNEHNRDGRVFVKDVERRCPFNTEERTLDQGCLERLEERLEQMNKPPHKWSSALLTHIVDKVCLAEYMTVTSAEDSEMTAWMTSVEFTTVRILRRSARAALDHTHRRSRVSQSQTFSCKRGSVQKKHEEFRGTSGARSHESCWK